MAAHRPWSYERGCNKAVASHTKAMEYSAPSLTYRQRHHQPRSPRYHQYQSNYYQSNGQNRTQVRGRAPPRTQSYHTRPRHQYQRSLNRSYGQHYPSRQHGNNFNETSRRHYRSNPPSSRGKSSQHVSGDSVEYGYCSPPSSPSGYKNRRQSEAKDVIPNASASASVYLNPAPFPECPEYGLEHADPIAFRKAPTLEETPMNDGGYGSDEFTNAKIAQRRLCDDKELARQDLKQRCGKG